MLWKGVLTWRAWIDSLGFFLPSKPFYLVTVCLVVFLFPVACGSTTLSLDRIVEGINGSVIWDTCLRFEEVGNSYLGFRYTGGPGGSAAADWIAENFREMGLQTREEEFEFDTWFLDSEPSMEVVFENGTAKNVGSFICEFWTIGMGPEEVEAPLVVLPCPQVSGLEDLQTTHLNRSEWDAKDISDCVVLTGLSSLMSGEWSDVLAEKLVKQKPRLIVYARWYDFLSLLLPEFHALVGNRTWGADPAFGDLPVGYSSYEDSVWLRQLDGTRVRVRIQTHMDKAKHRNIIGVLGSPGSQGSQVVVCAHYDSALTPGFVDDGTGISAMLEIARVLSGAVKEGLWDPDFDIFFVAFDAEEVGCVGSLNYVAQHGEDLERIKAVFSLDSMGANRMVATSPRAENVTEVYRLLSECASSLGLSLDHVGYSGDHTSFQDPLSILDWSLGKTGTLRDTLARLDYYVGDSIGIGSSPVFQMDLWWEGVQGWIHTVKDNSETAVREGWVTSQNLELQTKAIASAIMRMGEAKIIGFSLLLLLVGLRCRSTRL